MRYLPAIAALACALAGCTSAQDTAFAACTAAVSDKLVSPASAAWSDAKNAVVLTDHNTHALITGHVDSQNSFGAMLRSNFMCDMSRDSTGAWVVTDTIAMPAA